MWWIIWTIYGLQCLSIALAHNAQQHWLSVTVYSSSLRIKATPPIEQFLEYDSNQDGILSSTEVQNSLFDIQKNLERRVVAFNQDLRKPTIKWKKISIQQQQLSIHFLAEWKHPSQHFEIKYLHQDSHNIPMYIRRGQEIEQRTLTPEKRTGFQQIER